MTTLLLTNDAIAPSDFAELVEAVKYFVPIVTKAWNLPDVVVTTTPSVNDWVVNVTEKNRHPNASGYHVDTLGIPTAFCSPRACGRLWGHYLAPLVIPAVTVGGKIITPAKTIHGALFTPGLITTVAHEITEMLVDSAINNFSAPDGQGRDWLVEPCDHVFGTYLIHSIGPNVCVFPNSTTPEFYKVNGVKPFDLAGIVTAPFTMTPEGYAYEKTPNGLVAIKN